MSQRTENTCHFVYLSRVALRIGVSDRIPTFDEYIVVDYLRRIMGGMLPKAAP
jgi:hypothetical protein